MDIFKVSQWPKWGTPIEIERRRRIRLSMWAYAYEIAGQSLVTDAQFDAEARLSDLSIETGRLDGWWAKHFTPSSGMWIHHHPELAGIKRLFEDMRNAVQV